MKIELSQNIIDRRALSRLEYLAESFPVVLVTGPRQSGKTTLCRMALPDLSYVSLENPAQRALIASDPRSFFERHSSGVILDEVQRFSELPSFLQELVDRDPRPGRFVLTGSQHFGLTAAVSQSLAGRTGLLELLPLERGELESFAEHPRQLWESVWTGGYPAIPHRHLDAAEWLAGYAALYLERDVRQVLNVNDLAAFQTFVRLLAGRSGSLVNLSSLGADAGVSHNTVRSWLGVLEASYIALRLPPLMANLRKRLVRTPKVYFLDSGLVCLLLGISRPEHLDAHPLRGAVFEGWVVSETVKWLRHRGRRCELCFYRDRAGRELDLVLRDGAKTVAIEIKSSRTFTPDFLPVLDEFAAAAKADPLLGEVRRAVVYGGDESFVHGGADVVAWREVGSFLDRALGDEA